MSQLRPLALESQRIFSVLSENLPWSPFDFIRAIDRGGDRQMRAEHLTRAIAPDDDLRFLCSEAPGAEVAICAERLPWDSDFFGYGVARLEGVYCLSAPYFRPQAEFADPLRLLLRQASARGIRYLFAQVDARDLALLRALGQLGFSLIETRLIYHGSLAEHEGERYPVRVATAEDVPSLGRTAQERVNGYDRFHADPFINPEDAARLMYRWAEVSVCEGFADSVIVPDLPDPAAFITLKYHRDKWPRWGLKLSQGVLVAVSPERKGWYPRLLSELLYHLRGMGADHIYHVTQVTNRVVVWTWESLGHHYGRSEHILRIVL
jgi:hypothetical protein